ncbi:MULTISPECIES: hypothetical protein [unclassified Burkholderia]|uniref:hypothetical protein n=1 Tax=unclassified Burkholderia TaxID=2613784 RepID=UPI00142127D4|nr:MULTISPECIES: hypothetical protein [unclassified Burkholderia]NIE58454.1 hypothetical protein [Burkholderia sp. Ap-955]NIF10990.1 hypothetical protein [Burkholderia sp. Ax-1735]NIG04724.1 hypothetical protein [Burkholderia sp. Tr-849]
MTVGIECACRVRACVAVVQSIEIPSPAKEHRRVSCLMVRVRAGTRTMSGAARCGVATAFGECTTGARARQAVMGDAASGQCDQEKTD